MTRRPRAIAILSCTLMLSAAAPAQPQNAASSEADSLQVQMRKLAQLWQAGKMDEAVAILERLRAAGPAAYARDVRAGICYNLACGYARLDRPDRAIAALQDAADLGFARVSQLEQDPDLESIRNDPRFAALIALIRTRNTFFQSPAFRSDYAEKLDTDLKVAGLSRLWAEIRFGLANVGEPATDLDALYLSFLPRVRQAGSTLEYYRLLERFCAAVHDGHTRVELPPELFAATGYRPALRTRLVEGRIVVTAVESEDLTALGLRPGLIVEAIEDMPARRFAQEHVAPHVSASTPQGHDALAYGLYLLLGARGSTVRLAFRTADGKPLTHVLKRTRPINAGPPAVEYRRLDDGTAYVRLNSFGRREAVARFAAAFSKLKDAPRLILDLRNNTGGDGGIGFAILSHLTEHGFATAQWRPRVYRAYDRARGLGVEWGAWQRGRWPGANGDPYRGPVALLVGPLTASAAEDFCVAFRAMGRGPIIGAATAGTTGQPLSFPLPGGGIGMVCTIQSRLPDGTEFVGKGIVPDVQAVNTIADLRAGRDRVLEAAIERLR